MLAALAAGLGKSTFPASQSQELLGEVARAYGHPINFSVLSTVSIFGDSDTGRFRLQAIDGSYRFDQIAGVQEQLARALTGTEPAADIREALEQIDMSPPPRATWLRVVGYGIACVGFAAAVRINPGLLLLAFVLGLAVGAALVIVRPKSRSSVLLPVTATFACALAVGVISNVAGLDDSVRMAAVPVLFLLPGAAISAAVIELVNGDMLAGSSRLIFAIMQFLAMGFAFVLAIDVAGVPTADLIDLSAHMGPSWLAWVGALVFAGGLSLFACLPWRLWSPTLLLAIFAFAVQVLAAILVAPPLAGGVAAALALLGAYVLNRRAGSGPTAFVLFIPAFWLIVPGSVGFTALTGVLTQNESLTSLGPQAAFTFVAMGIGIMLASLVWASVADLRRHLSM